MSKRLHFVFTLVFVLTLAGNCLAVTWSDGGADHLWSTGANWVGGSVPTSGQNVSITNGYTGPVIDSTVAAVAAVIWIGGGSAAETLTITGGTLTSNHLILGEGLGSTVTMDMSGGSLNIYSLWAGNNGDGTFTMTGGTIVITGEQLYVSRFGGQGHVQLDGGTITTPGLYMNGGFIDITGGTLILQGDDRGTISTYQGNGWITAFGGNSTVNVVYNGSTTTVTAEPLIKAWGPDPEDGSSSVEIDVELSWSAGDGAVSHDVYFGTTNPPAFIQNQPGTTYDPPGDFSLNTTYYWRIDEVNGGTVTGDVWSFTVRDQTTAWNPDPVSGASGVASDAILSWSSGTQTVSHDVYFGATDPPVFIQNQPLGQESYDPPGDLVKGLTYYWKIDEVNDLDTYEGIIWNFTVSPGAASLSWDDGGADHLWNTSANWNPDDTPGMSTDVAITNSGSGPLIDSTVTAACNVIRLGGSGLTNTLDMTGGSLTTNSAFILGEGSGSTAIFNMDGGSVEASSIWVGNNGDGVLNVSGGTMNISGEPLYVSRFGGAGHVQLDGGTINTKDFIMSDATASMDLAGGVLIIEGYKKITIDSYVYNGWVTAYGGNGSGTVSVTYDGTNTTVVGVVNYAASNPNPPDDAFAAQPVVLEWASGYQALSHNVYYGTDHTGDIDDDGEVGIDDLSIMTLQWLDGSGSADIAGGAGINLIDFSALAAEWQETYMGNRPVTEYTPTEALTVGQTYYWRIDEVYSGDVVKGDLWSFTAVSSEPEFIDDPIVEVNGIVDFSYNAAIDDDAIFACNIVITFEKLSGPAWLNVAADGTLSGMPGAGDAGANTFVVKVSDDSGGFDTATLNISVALAPPSPPEVWADYDPDAGAYNETIVAEWDAGGVHYKDFYISAYVNGEEIRMFCKYAAQIGATNQPAILDMHGWTGAPFISSEFISRGYAIMSQDYTGYYDESRPEYTKYPPALAHGSPFIAEWVADPDVKATSDYIWDAMARRALSYMATQPEVDTDRMGASGFSYGGTIIWSLATDPRLKAVCAFHGVGWIKYYRDHGIWRYDLTPPGIEPSEQDLIYLAGIAPQAYAPYINCPVLFLNGSNDHHGNQDRSYESFDLLPDGVPWATAQQANAMHNTDDVRHILYPWMQKWVKGESVTWPDNPESEIRIGAGGVPEFVLDPASPADVASVEIYYALEEPFNMDRTWFYATVVRTGDTWTALLPVVDVDNYVFAYANITYNSTIVISSNFEAEVPSWIGAP